MSIVTISSKPVAAGVDRLIGVERWITATAVMFIASMATLVRSYLAIKLSFLALFLLAFLVGLYLKRIRVVVHPRLVWFYLLTATAGLTWGFVGLLHHSNYRQGVYDSLKLYVLWSAAFFVLYTILRSVPSLRVFHIAMVAAGILIPLINFVGLYDQFNGLGFVPEGVRQELGLEIGLWDSYIQINSVNILSMFLVAPYLLALQFRDTSKSNSKLTKLELALSLVLVTL
jgi:hypothetical protein